MDAATVTAIAALIGSLLAGGGAVYGHRIAGRTQREGGVIGGYDTLTGRLEARLEKAEASQTAAETRAKAAESEIVRLQRIVVQLGGTP
ncbi:MAG TPA: hypothetical protein VK698_39770 [Kofleriaceae bacterium]|nr:hypothetical protein [Kofleriaceae bacterium]